MKTSLYIQNIQHIIIRINNGVSIYKNYGQFLLFLLLFKQIPRQRGSESPVVEPKQEVIDLNSCKLRNSRTVLMEMV